MTPVMTMAMPSNCRGLKVSMPIKYETVADTMGIVAENMQALVMPICLMEKT